MSQRPASDDRRTRVAVRRLLNAIDRALAAAREIEAARTTLDRESRRVPPLSVVPFDSEWTDAK
jgi:hypothetical protein